jgi:cell division protein FtsB
MTSTGAAGRGPGTTKRPAATRTARPRPAATTRAARVESEPDPAARQTALTARAAVLVLAVAAVAVAVALPLKIWIAQRNNIASLTAQTRESQVQLRQLAAQDKRWKDPGYIESQARERLHFVLPNQKTYIVLGRSGRTTSAAAKQAQAAQATGSWYDQFWSSEQAAGASTTAK